MSLAPSTSESLPPVSADAAAAALAAADMLGLAGPVRCEPVAGASALLPGPAPVAVATRVNGAASGTIVLVVAADVVETLSATPAGQLDAVTAIGPALQAALEALAGAAVDALGAEPFSVIDISLAQGLARTASEPAVALYDAAGRHAASVVVGFDPPAIEELPRQRGTVSEFRPMSLRGSVADAQRIDLLRDVPMAVTVQLGTTRMTVRDLLALTPGSIIELDRAAGSPVDVLVNGTLIARGEVVVVDEEYAVRISDIVDATPDDGSR